MCYCLCPVNHKSKRGICTGRVETVLDFQNAKTKEITTIGMCKPCRRATFDEAGGTAEARYA